MKKERGNGGIDKGGEKNRGENGGKAEERNKWEI